MDPSKTAQDCMLYHLKTRLVLQGNTIHDIMAFYECERLVETVEELSIKNYGSGKWFKQHSLVTKLNLQAHINAITRGDEFVMESLATFDKVSFSKK